MQHRIVDALQKYLLNPPIELLFALSIGPAGYALLETIGRKTGKPRRTPVGNGRVGAQFWIVAEHDGLGAQQLDHFREQLPFFAISFPQISIFITARQPQ
jgi:hypothetical protein